MADEVIEEPECSFIDDVSPAMKDALIEYIRKSKSNATIVEYIRRDFGVDWSVRTLTRRLRALSIKRHVPVSQREILNAVSNEMTGPSRHIGYRHMHQRLRMRHDLPVKRNDVYKAMQTLGASGMEARRKRIYRRRDYVSVRIQAYWHNQRERNCRYWESEFEHLSANGLLVPDDPLHKASLQYVYMPLLRQELRDFVEEHNSHRIRKQHGKKTPQGIPEDQYSFPEMKGFKQAGFQPEQSDLDYLREEQCLQENLPDYLAAGFRSRADAFFDVEITMPTAQDAYIALVTHMQTLSA